MQTWEQGLEQLVEDAAAYKSMERFLAVLDANGSTFGSCPLTQPAASEVECLEIPAPGWACQASGKHPLAAVLARQQASCCLA